MWYSKVKKEVYMKRIKYVIFTTLALFIMITNSKAQETLQSKIDSNEKYIVLNDNYTENLLIKENQELTIDLNGYTIT